MADLFPIVGTTRSILKFSKSCNFRSILISRQLKKHLELWLKSFSRRRVIQFHEMARVEKPVPNSEPF